MKTLRQILFIAMLIAIPAVVLSCQEDDSSPVNNNGNCYEELQELSLILSNKANAFSANQTRSNCEALRTAALNQLEALDDCDDLTTQQREAYESAAQFWVDYDCTLWD